MTITVGIAGITGKFARCVVNSLLKSPGVSVRGFCRDPSKLPQAVADSPRIEVIQGHVSDRNTVQSFVKGCSVVICCYLGDAAIMLEGQKVLIDACELEAVPRYIAGDFSVDFTKIPYGALPPKDPCKDIMTYLSTRNVQGVHILIGVFMETFWSNFMPVWNPAETSISYWGTGHEVWELTTYGTAADYTAAVTLDDTATGIQHFLGDRQSTLQIAQNFKNSYGTSPTMKNLGSLDELYADMHHVLNTDPSNIFAWMPKFFHYWSQTEQARLRKDLDNAKYPQVAPVTLDQFLKSHKMDQLALAADNLAFDV